ncbi:MAG: MTH1187 family thiamine-binding protein [Chlorobiaceae bacterium]|nr:MTH1187 family thiamine-binding protein [Chlorobiaceae bacterium]NTW73651.1 MTH1187 family thiamine-binding protein [Chlorobiaceae bacterium]
MALMDITVVPLGTGEGGLSPWIAGLEALLAKSGLPFRLHDMGTTVEGSADELFAVARQMHEYCFLQGASRVYTVMKVDDRRDRRVSIGDKVSSVHACMAAPDK